MALTSAPGNYVIGRGRVYFAPYLLNTKTPGPELYLGNTPEAQIAITAKTLEHFSSEAGVKEVDEAATLETTRKMTLKTDNISPQNIALFFLGQNNLVTTAGATVTAEVIAASQVASDALVQLGFNPATFRGARNITAGSVVIKDGTSTVTYIEGTDYEINYESGMLHVLPTGAIVTNIPTKPGLVAAYAFPTYSNNQAISGASSIEGMMRFISDNPTGANSDYTFPYVRLSPTGNFMLKGDTWQEIDFEGEIIRLGTLPAMMVDGRAV